VLHILNHTVTLDMIWDMNNGTRMVSITISGKVLRVLQSFSGTVCYRQLAVYKKSFTDSIPKRAENMKIFR